MMKEFKLKFICRNMLTNGFIKVNCDVFAHDFEGAVDQFICNYSLDGYEIYDVIEL